MKFADALSSNELSVPATTVAKACGVHLNTVLRWRKFGIPGIHAEKVSKVLGVPVDANKVQYLPLEDGVPIPPRERLGAPGRPKPNPGVPFFRMQVGQSCFIPETLYPRPTVMNNAAAAAQRLGFRFCARKMIHKGKLGCRVWRIE